MSDITQVPTPELTAEQKANACLNDINGALKKYGFDLQVFHELITVKNAHGGTEISVQHTQKFIPIKPPEVKTDGQ